MMMMTMMEEEEEEEGEARVFLSDLCASQFVEFFTQRTWGRPRPSHQPSNKIQQNLGT